MLSFHLVDLFIAFILNFFNLSFIIKCILVFSLFYIIIFISSIISLIWIMFILLNIIFTCSFFSIFVNLFYERFRSIIKCFHHCSKFIFVLTWCIILANMVWGIHILFNITLSRKYQNIRSTRKLNIFIFRKIAI